MKLYMAVTADKYELPLIVSENRKDVAEYAKITVQTLDTALSKCYSGKNGGIKFIILNIKESD